MCGRWVVHLIPTKPLAPPTHTAAGSPSRGRSWRGPQPRRFTAFPQNAPFGHMAYHPEKRRFLRQFQGTFPAPRSGATERVPHGPLVDTHHRCPVEGDPPRRQVALPVAFDRDAQRPRKRAGEGPKTGPFWIWHIVPAFCIVAPPGAAKHLRFCHIPDKLLGRTPQQVNWTRR